MLNSDSSCCIWAKDVDISERVIHHCHLTGKLFGIAHSKCNLRARTTNFLPIFFHNLSRYDAHHIIKKLQLQTSEELTAIAKTDETYISFNIKIPVGSYKKKSGDFVKMYHSLRFLDSFQFVSQSLENLAKTLTVQDFKHLRESFAGISDNLFLKITRKGFFPYSYLDCFKKFEKPLPEYGSLWKNTLTGKIDISLSDYQYAIDVYNLFGCKNLGEYHDIYLKTDVLILADIFEKFRSVCLNVYKLDPSHFFSAPNLSWEAMLISTNVKLGLLEDIDMLLFFERAIRGGINGVGELRHFKANNPHMDSFDPNKATTFGAFFDVTSLYAGTMQKMMPLGNYKWNTEITIDEILQTSEESSVGYFVEVDLEYPPHLHDIHNGLPLAPEKLSIQSSWLSPYAKSFNIKVNKTPKLVETLLNKKKYVCHYQNLKFYVKHGLKVSNLHRVCAFQQSKWLGVYIDKNTVMRKQATNDFEKNFYILMSNACFGKTMENLRKRSRIKFVSTPQQAEVFAQQATFKSFQIISDDLVSISFKSSSVIWNKPTPVGAAILDLSKLSLYKFHYEEMVPRYSPSKLKVLYKDTDSLLYRVETTDLYNDMVTFKHLLDFPIILENMSCMIQLIKKSYSQ